MLATLELILEWIAAIILLGLAGYGILSWIGYIVYRRNHKDEDI